MIYPWIIFFAVGVFVDYFEKLKLKDLVIVSPDVGGIKMARAYAKRLSAGLAIVDKRRISPESTEAVHILGDIEDKNVILVDDLVSTGSSLIEAVEILAKRGAKEIRAAITHGVLCGSAIERIDKNKNLKELLISDSIPLMTIRNIPGYRFYPLPGS